MKFSIKNGYKISELTLGTVQLGLAYGVNNDKGMPTFEESSKILDTALTEGVISFDTARAYGDSELVLKRYFEGESREHTFITKAVFSDVDKSGVKDRLFGLAKESIERLGIEKIPFLKLHSQDMLEQYGDTLVYALQDLKREGLADGIGVSFSDKSNLRKLTEGVGFDCVQLPANIFDSQVITDGSIKRLSDAGCAVFVRSVYLQGLFFKDTSTLPEKIKSAKAPLDKLHALARDVGVSMAELAISFIRDTEGITSLVLGCDTPEQLKESISLINAPRISPEVARECMKIAEEVEPVVIRPWEWFK